MPVFNLTRLYPLVEDRNRLNPDNLDPGNWSKLSNFGGAKLETLAMNIAPATSLETIKAVPDPWAHPRTFAASVLDPAHPLHSVAIGQWRWLLAIIGLSRFRENDYDLKVAGAELDPNGNRLEDMLVSLMPKKHLWTQASDAAARSDWRSLALIRLIDHHDGATHDIGLMNPGCLVSSGRRFGAVRDIVPTVPWITAGMKDPVELLGADEKRLLKSYLVELHKSLHKLLRSTADTNWGLLSARISEFEATIGDVAPGKPNFETREATLKPLYRPLMSVPNEERAETDCLIAGTHLILIDETAAE